MAIPKMHTPAEAALLTRCTENWLRDKVRARAIPHHRPGGRIRFTDDDVEEIIRLTARPATAPLAASDAAAGSSRKPRSGSQPEKAPLLESRPPRRKGKAA